MGNGNMHLLTAAQQYVHQFYIRPVEEKKINV